MRSCYRMRYDKQGCDGYNEIAKNQGSRVPEWRKQKQGPDGYRHRTIGGHWFGMFFLLKQASYFSGCL